ncbi:hypothetical protein [Fortiea contorta]|uniref:hypothetical protein n=1 Tax=Fortiea contorta TaxID=1892405 RepID=UPI000347AF6F|nr:hypothetical protein [Fortiea contorta]
MSAIITTNQQIHLDVDFSILNDLAARLRAAGAKIKVRKIGKFYRIALLKPPKIATVEQILSYTNHTEINPDVLATQINEDRRVAPSDVISTSEVSPEIDSSQTPDNQSAELATVEELTILPAEKLQELAKLNKIIGRIKMKPNKLAEKLHGLVTKDQLT